MFNRIATAMLASTLNVAWPLCRAKQNATLAESDAVASFWEHVGSAGEALEALVDRLAIRWGIDIAGHMYGR